MKRSAALEKLAALKLELDKLGIKSLAVFGSVARDKARSDSDIDLLVEFHRISLNLPASSCGSRNFSDVAST